MVKPFKPLLADDFDPAKLKFPVWASPKLDGIRAICFDGIAMSRSMKPIRNRFVQAWFREHAEVLQGLDGELIVGSPTDPEVYNKTNSGVMSEKFEPNFTFYVFDKVPFGEDPGYNARLLTACEQIYQHESRLMRLKILHPTPCDNEEQLAEYEAECLAEGYEGIMVRAPHGRYKQGRSTVNEGILLKVKRFKDAEAHVVDFEEQMSNQNLAGVNELGHTKRSTAKAGLVPAGVLGALVLEGLTAYHGVRFNVGTGFSAALRAQLWAERKTLVGRIVKFRYFDIGVKDAPRFPVFVGFRDPSDL